MTKGGQSEHNLFRTCIQYIHCNRNTCTSGEEKGNYLGATSGASRQILTKNFEAKSYLYKMGTITLAERKTSLNLNESNLSGFSHKHSLG